MFSPHLFLLRKDIDYLKIKLLYKFLNINFSNLQKSFNLLYLFIKYLYKYLVKVTITNSELVIYLKKKTDLLFVLSFLKYHYTLQFKELVDICAVDFCFSRKFLNRFELNYILLSLINKCHLRVKINTSIDSNVISLCGLYSSSNWLERENWDMFGIFFSNHFDLRRILTDYGFEGFPLRKDFPLSGYIEMRFDEERKILVYDLIELAQEFRFFEFINPWVWSST